MGVDLQGGRRIGSGPSLAGRGPAVRGGGEDRRPLRGTPVPPGTLPDEGRPAAGRGPRSDSSSARDLDVLRFRADSRINAIVREVAAAQGAADVRFADAERALAESDPAAAGVAGEDLFYEHVHLTFEGNYVLARAVLGQVAAALPQLAGKHGAVPSRQRCAELLVLTPGDEYQAAAVVVNITSRPPFTNQLDHALRQAAARRHRDDLHRRALSPQAVQSARKAYEAALAESPGNWELHYHFGALALEWGQPKLAEEHLRIATEKVPWDARTHNLLGSALAGQGRFDEAVAQYRKALEISPDSCRSREEPGGRPG